jgi:glycerol kinase
VRTVAETGKSYILGLDQGTTGSTALLCDSSGRVITTAYHEINQIYPQPGYVEQNPEEYISNSILVAGEAIRKSGVPLHNIRGMGITNQRETTIVWDKATGKPVYNAIVWQCRRTAPMCEELKKRGLESKIKEKTGLPVDAYFSATKIRCILDAVPDGQSRAENGELLFGTVDTWLIWNFTGGKVHVTDYSNASRTMLFNIHTLQWDTDLLKELNIPAVMLPKLVSSSGIFGFTDPGTICEISIPMASIAGDQQAALFGEACYERGMAKNTYGTGSFVMLNTGTEPVLSKNGLITTVAWGLRDTVSYAMEGSIFVTGAAIQWLRDGLEIIGAAGETEKLARSVSDNGGVYFVPAFVGLGAPYWDMYARGTIIGITRGTTRAHIVRAALESIACQARDVLNAMEADAAIKIPLLRVDGGGTANKFLLQFQSDLLGIPIQRMSVPDVTALGVVYLAGLAVGIWADTDDLSKRWKAEETFEPKMPEAQREELYGNWKRAVERSRNWVKN